MAFIHVHIGKQLVTLQSPKVEQNIYLDLEEGDSKATRAKLKALEGKGLELQPMNAKSIQKLRSKRTLIW